MVAGDEVSPCNFTSGRVNLPQHIHNIPSATGLTPMGRNLLGQDLDGYSRMLAASRPLHGSGVVSNFARGDNLQEYCFKAARQGGGLSVPLGFNGPGSSDPLCGPGYGASYDIPGPGHLVTFGANRSGKGKTQIVPALMTYDGNIVAVSPKGEEVWITYEHRKRMGRVVLLDPYDEVNTRYGKKAGKRIEVSKFNPLSILDPSHPDFADHVADLAHTVIVPAGSDPHWPDSARELIGGLIAAVCEKYPRVATFGDVRDLLLAPDEVLKAVVEEIVAVNPASLAGRKLARFLEKTKEISSIRSQAVTQTAIFDAGTLLASMETTPEAFKFSELATGRVTLYLVLPVGKLTSHGRWLRLMLTLALSAVENAGQKVEPPCLYLIDEAGTFTPGTLGGGLTVLQRAAGLSAGLGVRLWLFYQDITQLRRDFPDNWETFIGNAGVVTLLRVNETSTARYFSDYLGTKTAGQGYNRPVRLPQEIMMMPANRALILFSGGPYFELNTVSYYENPAFSGLYQDNPDYPPNPPAQPRGSHPVSGQPVAPFTLPFTLPSFSLPKAGTLIKPVLTGLVLGIVLLAGLVFYHETFVAPAERAAVKRIYEQADAFLRARREMMNGTSNPAPEPSQEGKQR